MGRHARLEQLETWVEAIRDGHYAQFLLAKIASSPEYRTGRWSYLAAPLVDWQTSTLRKASDSLMPVTVECDFVPDLYSAGFSTVRVLRAGSRAWAHTFEAGEGLRYNELRARLHEMVLAGNRATDHMIEWSAQPRFEAARDASASISMAYGVTDGFVFSLSDVQQVADDLTCFVLDLCHRFAGIVRFDSNGSKLCGRPKADIECAIRSYVRTRPYRLFAKMLGMTERKLRSQLKDGGSPPVWQPSRYVMPIDFTDEATVSLPSMPSMPKPAASAAADAAAAFEAVSDAGGARAAAVKVLRPGKGGTPAGLRDALLLPWAGLDEGSMVSVLRALAGSSESDAHGDWCEALHWSAAYGEPAATLGRRLTVVAGGAADGRGELRRAS